MHGHRIVQANKAVSPTENQPQHRRIQWGSPWRSDALKNSIFSDFASSDGIFAEHTPSKQTVMVATPTVATTSFAAATSSHDPNPILQSSYPYPDKARSAVYRCSQTAPKRAELRRAYVARVQKLSVLHRSRHLNCPRTSVLVRLQKTYIDVG